MILESAGYVMKSAENGKEALEILDKEHFDLILMDGEMPVMNGYKAAAEIRKGEVFKNFKGYKTIPIISLMASSDQSTIEKAKNSGMNGYMSKGTSKKEILEIIESYLSV
jgi:CheY-like chemotaxis protein